MIKRDITNKRTGGGCADGNCLKAKSVAVKQPEGEGAMDVRQEQQVVDGGGKVAGRSVASRLVSALLIIAVAIVIMAGTIQLTGGGSATLVAWAQGAQEQQVIDIAAAHPAIKNALDRFPDWSAEAYVEDEDANIWGVEFYEDQAREEWLAWAQVNMNSQTVTEYYAPAYLSPEEEARQQAAVEAAVLADAEALALLGDPNDWDQYTDYDPWEGLWHVYFEKGLDAWAAEVEYGENDEVNIWRLFDPYQLTEEEARETARNQAIEIAYEAEGVWDALDGYDDWKAYVTLVEEPRWAVSFVSGEQELFFALVDVEAWQVIESGAGDQGRSYLPLVTGN